MLTYVKSQHRCRCFSIMPHSDLDIFLFDVLDFFTIVLEVAEVKLVLQRCTRAKIQNKASVKQKYMEKMYMPNKKLYVMIVMQMKSLHVALQTIKICIVKSLTYKILLSV